MRTLATRRFAPLGGRFAVLADIHGNADALRAVQADMAQFQPEDVLVLGDHFSGPLDAAGTAGLLLRHRILALRGNHDRYLLEQSPTEMGRSDRVALEALEDVALDWLAGLPEVMDFGDVWACHAMPGCDDVYWTHEVARDGTVSLRHVDDIAAEVAAAGIGASLILCAHTHLPVTLRLPTGQILLNPGSVGCPAYEDELPVPHVIETGHAHAAWALVERQGDHWSITQRFVPYDTTQMVARARAHARWDWARAVETGFL
ncbi:metallophosphatase family protein [Pseudooceanicola sp. CBS1P-1]|uniref:Metallophosphoesterase n=1 Tax=Pseudooceanicola albus TaxID=2692189 RepID=A0A6L7GBB9_9RHOB|nr:MULTISPECIES: metallophosphoesterase family protein [Pseudooceanicola]MBT9384274.1 metallophosphatase family protein [Pseudooceanicola endophyticus]MXN20867.1 metallophosphoesterase [Pseudooceanicola albus]